MLTILVVLVVDKFLPKIITLGVSVIIVDTKDMEDFPSGQRERTVNPLLYVSMVQIHHLPPPNKNRNVFGRRVSTPFLTFLRLCHLVYKISVGIFYHPVL